MFVAWLSTLLGRLCGRPRHATWPFAFELVVRFLRLDWDETAKWDDAKLREELNARPYPRRFLKKVTVVESSLGGVPAWRFVPPRARAGRYVLFLHGGSYIYGSARTTHAELLARIAFESGIEVIGLDYRLAPKHRYPSQLEDALSAFDALVSNGIDAHHILIAGDSAGGNLALVLQIALRDRGGPQAAAMALSSPWVNLEMSTMSYEENDHFDYGTREVLARQALAFAADVPLSDPRISPIHANLQRLAPCFISVGDLEIPRDDIVELAKRLRSAGVDVTLHVARNMPHNAPVFAEYHPEGKAAFNALVQFTRAHLA
jgi:epsilon-lactone hydrolase